MAKPAFTTVPYDPLDDPYCCPASAPPPRAVTSSPTVPQMDFEEVPQSIPKPTAPVLVPTTDSSEDPLQANKLQSPPAARPLGPDRDNEAPRPRPRVSRKASPAADPVSTKSCQCELF